jgi:hypothetical protein
MLANHMRNMIMRPRSFGMSLLIVLIVLAWLLLKLGII